MTENTIFKNISRTKILQFYNLKIDNFCYHNENMKLKANTFI